MATITNERKQLNPGVKERRYLRQLYLHYWQQFVGHKAGQLRYRQVQEITYASFKTTSMWVRRVGATKAARKIWKLWTTGVFHSWEHQVKVLKYQSEEEVERARKSYGRRLER